MNTERVCCQTARIIEDAVIHGGVWPVDGANHTRASLKLLLYWKCPLFWAASTRKQSRKRPHVYVHTKYLHVDWASLGTHTPPPPIESKPRPQTKPFRLA